MYALYSSSEDGNPLAILNDSDLADLLEDPKENFGINKFEGEEFLNQHPDPNYWPPNVAVLLEIKVVEPRPATWCIR